MRLRNLLRCLSCFSLVAAKLRLLVYSSGAIFKEIMRKREPVVLALRLPLRMAGTPFDFAQGNYLLPGFT
jgi:hypothetical protein